MAFRDKDKGKDKDVGEDMAKEYLESETEHMADRETVDDEGQRPAEEYPKQREDGSTDYGSEPSEPITTMADQGIETPLTHAEQAALQEQVADTPPTPEPYIYDFPKTPWAMLPHETMYSNGLQIARVPGGWIYSEEGGGGGIALTFVPYLPATSDPAIWK